MTALSSRAAPGAFTALGLAFAAAVALTAPLPAQAQKLVPAQSEIGFVTRQMGVPVDGRFRKFDAQIAFDPKKPEAAKIAFTIDLGSAAIGTAETEAELAKPDWFNLKAFPQAGFQSTAVKALGGGRYEVAGTLTIKGAKQDVVVPVTLAPAGSNATATGSFTLKRLDFRIGEGDWKDTSLVANEVQVRFKLALSGLPPQ
ncbi:YceI family protein [Piscinibacter sakaiensis]|uniref:Putative signal peptide protein n=1 Tax=Piscinibacter sakaiensis TaxID=1547922 RepID=A0A0K8P1J3_PISS1|nr:YceI family protein [Piscinibacter sakaiensis]GAP36493.1 putative signal peptide protein [Piscinibacter sakaiensis]